MFSTKPKALISSLVVILSWVFVAQIMPTHASSSKIIGESYLDKIDQLAISNIGMFRDVGEQQSGPIQAKMLEGGELELLRTRIYNSCVELAVKYRSAVMAHAARVRAKSKVSLYHKVVGYFIETGVTSAVAQRISQAMSRAQSLRTKFISECFKSGEASKRYWKKHPTRSLEKTLYHIASSKDLRNRLEPSVVIHDSSGDQGLTSCYEVVQDFERKAYQLQLTLMEIPKVLRERGISPIQGGEHPIESIRVYRAALRLNTLPKGYSSNDLNQVKKMDEAVTQLMAPVTNLTREMSSTCFSAGANSNRTPNMMNYKRQFPYQNKQ